MDVKKVTNFQEERVEARIARLKEDLRLMCQGLAARTPSTRDDGRLNERLSGLGKIFAEVLDHSSQIQGAQKQSLETAHEQFRKAIERYENCSNSSQIPQDRELIFS